VTFKICARVGDDRADESGDLAGCLPGRASVLGLADRVGEVLAPARELVAVLADGDGA